MRHVFGVFVVLMTGLLAACEKHPAQPAPLNDKAVLEKLAGSYEKLSEDLPVGPARLTPKERKSFVEQVFAENGYGYQATLHQLAESSFTAADQEAKDLVELLTLPHRGAAAAVSLKEIYSEEEIRDLRKLEERFGRLQ